MKGFFALLRREYLEHRGAFLYAPLVLVAIQAVLLAIAFFSGHARFSGPSASLDFRLFDNGYLGIAVLWGGYLFIAVFFYFADAFIADRRNNQIYFWKSMPVSDLEVLLSKLVAGLTILPALIFFVLLLSGIVAAVASFLAPLVLPLLSTPDPAAIGAAWLRISLVALCYFVLMLLWYTPFFAWVGALSTVVGRWSIGLALLVPAIASLLEGVIDFGAAPGGSYVLSFLKQRLSFNFDLPYLQYLIFSTEPIDPLALATRLVAAVDWLSLALGLVFALLVIWLASEYRRRRVLKG